MRRMALRKKLGEEAAPKKIRIAPAYRTSKPRIQKQVVCFRDAMGRSLGVDPNPAESNRLERERRVADDQRVQQPREIINRPG